MKKEHIKFWYIQADCLLTFEISCTMCKEANKQKSILSIDLVIDGDCGKGAFGAIIKINAKFT